MITKVCEICSKEFQVKPYREKTARFCSKKCGGSWHAKTRLAHIKKPWAAKNLDGHRHKSPTKFTSERVRGSDNPSWVEAHVFSCERCGREFKVKPWLVRQNGKPRFCGRDCFENSGAFTGSNSSSYVGGPKTYRGRNWLVMRKKAIDRDNATCQNCGSVEGDSISVHHIIPDREFDDYISANVLTNLVSLCQRCHMIVENQK